MKYQNATNKMTQFFMVNALIWPWGQWSPTMVGNTSSGGGLPTCQIWKAYLERQKGYSPDTICYGKITNLTLRSKVTNNGTQHIVWRWSTYMQNIQSLSWTTKKLQPGHDLGHDLLWTHRPVWPWGQSSRSNVTNNGTRHIVWRWSTYMSNMKSLSSTTKKLQPKHDLLRMQGPIWPLGQN